MKQRILTLLLCALLVTPTLLSCSGEEAQETQKSATPTENESETEVDTSTLTDYERRQLVSDDLESTDFGGRDFRVLTTSHDTWDAVEFEIVADELTGDACNDAVYNRNLEIETRFNTKVTCRTDKNPHSVIQTSVQAGMDDYELVGSYNYKVHNFVSSWSVLNWLNVPHVNLEKPWHNALANKNATINNRLYAICSDLSITSMTYTYATFFNIEMLESYGYSADDMYTLVRDGKWTIDKLSAMATEMYRDVNGNGKADKDDIFGYGYEITNPADVWLTAFDQPLFTMHNDNTYTINFMSEKTASIIDKLVNFHHFNIGVFQPKNQYDEQTYFVSGQFAMAPLRFHCAYTMLRNMETPYSMIPYPKWDEEQTAYYTNADDKYTAFMVPGSAYNNLDFVGTIFEALSAISYKKVYPEYYDIALKGKYATDASTAEMIDLIMAGRNFDFTFQFGTSYFQQLPYMIRNLLVEKSTNLASKYDSISKSLYNQIDNELLPLYGVSK